MASWILLFLSSTLTCLVTTHAQHSHQHRPDTVPESELRPVRPLDHPTTTQTSIHDPFELPDMPYQPQWMVPEYDEDYAYEEGMIHHPDTFTDAFQTVEYEDVTDVIEDGTTEEDEFDAHQGRLANSATIERMSYFSVLATTAVVLCSLHLCS